MRDEHCCFAVLNRNGRCIANCTRNTIVDRDTDCIGNEGSTFDFNKTHETRVQMGFLDGRNRVVDAKGYPVPADTPTIVVENTFDPDIIHTDVHGRKYQWNKTPMGLPYRRYLPIGG